MVNGTLNTEHLSVVRDVQIKCEYCHQRIYIDGHKADRTGNLVLFADTHVCKNDKWDETRYKRDFIVDEEYQTYACVSCGSKMGIFVANTHECDEDEWIVRP